jgi:hypothetical protein
MGNALAKLIWKLIDIDWTIEISHIYREANKCADAMANLKCSLDYDLVFYDMRPHSISKVFSNDNMGISTPRQANSVVIFLSWASRPLLYGKKNYI